MSDPEKNEPEKNIVDKLIELPSSLRATVVRLQPYVGTVGAVLVILLVFGAVFGGWVYLNRNELPVVERILNNIHFWTLSRKDTGRLTIGVADFKKDEDGKIKNLIFTEFKRFKGVNVKSIEYMIDLPYDIDDNVKEEAINSARKLAQQMSVDIILWGNVITAPPSMLPIL